MLSIISAEWNSSDIVCCCKHINPGFFSTLLACWKLCTQHAKIMYSCRTQTSQTNGKNQGHKDLKFQASEQTTCRGQTHAKSQQCWLAMCSISAEVKPQRSMAPALLLVKKLPPWQETGNGTPSTATFRGRVLALHTRYYNHFSRQIVCQVYNRNLNVAVIK